MKNRGAVLKEFGPAGLKVRQTVASQSSFADNSLRDAFLAGVFCLRMDADEYTPDSFRRYYRLFNDHKKAITIFFNVFSFKDAREEMIRCRDMGIDVQSHAFYHYTYSDYASNRYNINKAKKFFQEMGIEPKGFVAPYGRWNPSLQCALEDEGYEYSSEFSYDYMSFPSYPSLPGRRSNALQIPVFPVAPELFYQDGRIDLPCVREYFIKAIDEMVRCGLPIIIYAHTDPAMPDIPELLEDIAAYAISVKGLKPISMSGISDRFRNGDPHVRSVADRTPSEDFFGRPCRQKFPDIFKEYIKTALDFERITPGGELKCAPLKKVIKLLARRVLRVKKGESL